MSTPETRVPTRESTGLGRGDDSVRDSASDGLTHLICVRMLAAGKLSKSAVRSSLESFYSDQSDWNASAWRSRFDEALQAAQLNGLVTDKPLRLTERGREAATALLGFDPGAKAKWTVVKNRFLVATALGIKPPRERLERLGTADGLYAAVLVQHFGLPTEDVPTKAAALDAMAWQQLSFPHEAALPAQKRFTRKAVLEYALFDGKPASNPLLRLAAIATGAPRAEKIRNVIIGRWLRSLDRAETTETIGNVEAGSTQAPESREAASHEPRPDALELGEFANRVRELALHAAEGRFGRHKVFISHLWRRYRDDPATAEIDRATFDRYLLDAGRRGLLTLNRADLVEAMNPQDVRESEVRHPDGVGTVHFVRTDQ